MFYIHPNFLPYLLEGPVPAYIAVFSAFGNMIQIDPERPANIVIKMSYKHSISVTLTASGNIYNTKITSKVEFSCIY